MLLSPGATRGRRQFASSDRLALASIAMGGAAFALYSIGFVYGRVALVILLYFLTPIWSTLVGRFVMGWRTSRLRAVAILVGLTGLALMLGADGELPLPHGAGEWMALVAGLLWSIETTGMRARSSLGPGPAAFVFALGASFTSLVLAPGLAPLPDGLDFGGMVSPLGLALATGSGGVSRPRA